MPQYIAPFNTLNELVIFFLPIITNHHNTQHMFFFKRGTIGLEDTWRTLVNLLSETQAAMCILDMFQL